MAVWKEPIEIGPAFDGQFEINTLSNAGYVTVRSVGGDLEIDAFDHLGDAAWNTTINFPDSLSNPKIVAHNGTFTVIGTEHVVGTAPVGLTRFFTFTNEGALIRSVEADISFENVVIPPANKGLHK